MNENLKIKLKKTSRKQSYSKGKKVKSHKHIENESKCYFKCFWLFSHH